MEGGGGRWAEEDTKVRGWGGGVSRPSGWIPTVCSGLCHHNPEDGGLRGVGGWGWGGAPNGRKGGRRFLTSRKNQWHGEEDIN